MYSILTGIERVDCNWRSRQRRWWVDNQSV